MNVLIVGGTSGLGLELARKFSENNDKVVVTGRHNPNIDHVDYMPLDLSAEPLADKIKTFVEHYSPNVDVLVYAAGFYQEGTITNLSEEEIEEMINVCGRGLIYFCKYILAKQNKLDELIVITSSATWKLQRLEPIYSFMKAGEGHFANTLAEDGRISKVLVAAPSGTKTQFWRHQKHPEYEKFLDPKWVTEQIMTSRDGKYRYKHIKMFRNPAKLEVAETR